MDNIIYELVMAFSTNDLMAMIKGISQHSSNDTSLLMLACALCLSWMDHDSLNKVIKRINDATEV